ncbi:DUF5017 domain-containing protein [Polaribacter sp.]|nr:DUF5017 domain-containing protein [Polaribacter sp.]
MKKIFYSFAILSIVFSACNPMEDIYEEVDAQETIISGDATITLTEDNYIEDLDLDNNYFNTNEDAKSMLPDFLSNLYPAWGLNSSVIVNYELENGTDLAIVENYTSAADFTIDNADYPGASDNAVGFYQDENPAGFIPDILTENITAPAEGQVTLVKYKQYVGETVNGMTQFYTADFKSAGTLLDYEAVNVTGAQAWEETQSYGAKMSGYSGGSNENEDWLISPEIDLSSFSNALIQVNQVLNYGSYNSVSVLISKDYTGDPAAANWDVLNLTNVPGGNNWTPVLSDELSLSAYDGESINIAFRYTSTNSAAATWEIFDTNIKAPGVEGETKNEEVYYIYSNEEWVLAEGAYYLTSADYDSMGEESGQPGRYNNFSSSVAPNNYIPAFLQLTFPYAQEDDSILVFFKYYNGSTGVRGNEFTFIDGSWVAHQSKLQFGHDGNNWVPDNTIKYTLTAADYESVGNGYYQNFDVRAGKDEESVEARLAKINTILLNNFPSDADGQKYIVTYNIYNGAAGVWSMAVIKSGSAYILQ